MKILNASVELMKDIPEVTEHDEVLKFIERIGRVCYKSEDKITSESAPKFIKMLRDRKHWAMLEHYIFTFNVDYDTYEGLLIERDDYSDDPDINHYFQFIKMSRYLDKNDDEVCTVSASATALNYLWQHIPNPSSINDICQFMYKHYPELMYVPDGVTEESPNKDIEFLTQDKLNTYPTNIQLIHKWMSCKFITDTGVSHELCRHRPASYAQESSRYCSYNKSQFDGEVSFILPVFYRHHALDDKETLRYSLWRQACETSEQCYLRMIQAGATPQEARDVLTKSLKTEICMTANLFEFRHFFNMRADMAAHPQMREVAVPLLEQAITQYPGMFDDLKWRLDNHV